MKITIELNKDWESDVDTIIESLRDEYKEEFKSVKTPTKRIKKIKYYITLTEEQVKDWEIDMDKFVNDFYNYIQETDLACEIAPSMSGGRDYTPEAKDGETIFIKLGDRVFSFVVNTGDCVEATWCHTINETDISDFKEIIQ